MAKIESDDLINIAIRSGTLVLENGGETYRAEDTIVYTAEALGAAEPSAFVTPTVIMFSYQDEKKHSNTAMRRISRRGVNLRKISQVNALSRRMANRDKISPARQIEGLLDRIQGLPDYPKPAVVLAAALNSMFFALLFGGSIRDAAVALVIGALLRLFLIFLDRLPLNVFIVSLLAGSFISIFAELSLLCGFIPSSVIVTTAVLMQVVPGLAIVNAIRDMISGDLLSGNARLVEAFMIAAGLSSGSVLSLLVFSRLVH